MVHFKAQVIRAEAPNLVILDCGNGQEFYCDQYDLAMRERDDDGWKVHDHDDDDAIPENGPVWVHITNEQVAEIRRLF